MIFLIMFFICCILISIKKVLKPRVIPRLHERDIEVTPIMLIIILGYCAYKIFVENMSIEELRYICFQ